MKKSELKDKMILKLKNEKLYEIKNGKMIPFKKTNSFEQHLSYYNEDLLDSHEWRKDVIEIYSSINNLDVPIWKREEEIRELTKEDRKVLDLLLEDYYICRPWSEELYLLPPDTKWSKKDSFYEDNETYLLLNPKYFVSVLLEDRAPTKVGGMKKWKIID